MHPDGLADLSHARTANGGGHGKLIAAHGDFTVHCLGRGQVVDPERAVLPNVRKHARLFSIERKPLDGFNGQAIVVCGGGCVRRAVTVQHVDFGKPRALGQ